MSSEDFDFKVDFSQAIKQFEALANTQNKNSATLDSLVKAVTDYNASVDKMRTANEAVLKSNKELGTKLELTAEGLKQVAVTGREALIALKIWEFQTKKAADATSRFKQEFQDYARLTVLGNKAIAASAAATGDAALKSYRDQTRLLNLGRAAVTNDRNRASGRAALGSLTGRARSAREQQELINETESSLQFGIPENDRRRLEFLFNKANAGRGGLRPRTDVRPTPSPSQLTILQSRANTDNRSIDLTQTSENNSNGIGLGASAKYFLTYRALAYVKDQLVEATSAAQKFAKSITEIQTITQKTGKTFEDFRKEISAVSDLFGLKIEDVAEGTYQALSNQVVDAAHSFQFLSEAAKFAKVTNSSLADAVNLGSSALNSYGLSADHANEVFGKLFKGIELGRIRAEEISNSFGTIAAVAAPMGISLDEVVAALAKLTTDGVTAANAMTFLRNLIIKMARPTEELSGFFKELNYPTAQAAIATEGFTSILGKMFQKVDGNVEVAGELFHNIRAIQAEMGLAKKGAFSFAEALDKTKNSAESYGNAIKIATEDSAANRLAKQANEVRNELVSIGVDGINALHELIPNLNLLKAVTNAALVATVALTAAYGLESIAAIGAAESTSVLSRALLVLARNPIALAIAGITGAYIYAKDAAKKFGEEALKNNAEVTTSYVNKLNNELAPSLDKIAEKYRAMGRAISEQYRIAESVYATQKALVEQQKDTVIRAFEEETNAYKEQIAKLTALRNEFDTARKNSEEKKLEEKDRQRREDFEAELVGLSDQDKAQKLRTQSQIDQQRSQKIAARGDPKAIEEARKLGEQAVKDAQEAKKLDPGAEVSNSIKINQLLRERQKVERDLKRDNKLTNLSGDTGIAAKARVQNELELIQELNRKISAERNVPRLPGRPDTPDVLVEKAQKNKVDIETDFESAIRKNNLAFEEQTKVIQAQLDNIKSARDVFGDFGTEIKKAGSHTEELQNKLLKLAETVTGPVNVALKALAGQLGALGFATGNRTELSNTASTLNNKSQAAQERAKLVNQARIEQAVIDADVITKIGSLEPGGHPTIRSLIHSFKDKISKSELLREAGNNEGAREALTLTPQERKDVLVAYGIEKTSNNRTFGVFNDEERTNTLLQASNAIRQVPEATQKLRAAIESLISPISLLRSIIGSTAGAAAAAGGIDHTTAAGKQAANLEEHRKKYGGDSKANGGYSYTGGIHHPKEFIVNSLAAGKYRTLLEQINNGTESYVSNPGNKGYFDVRAYLRHFANISNTGSISGYEGENGSVNQLSFASGLRKQLESLSGLSFDSYRNGNFDLSPRIYSGFQGKDFGSVGGNPGRSYQFGDINITVAGGANSQVIAEGIRRDISRQLSTLS